MQTITSLIEFLDLDDDSISVIIKMLARRYSFIELHHLGLTNHRLRNLVLYKLLQYRSFAIPFLTYYSHRETLQTLPENTRTIIKQKAIGSVADGFDQSLTGQQKYLLFLNAYLNSSTREKALSNLQLFAWLTHQYHLFPKLRAEIVLLIHNHFIQPTQDRAFIQDCFHDTSNKPTHLVCYLTDPKYNSERLEFLRREFQKLTGEINRPHCKPNLFKTAHFVCLVEQFFLLNPEEKYYLREVLDSMSVTTSTPATSLAKYITRIGIRDQEYNDTLLKFAQELFQLSILRISSPLSLEESALAPDQIPTHLLIESFDRYIADLPNTVISSLNLLCMAAEQLPSHANIAEKIIHLLDLLETHFKQNAEHEYITQSGRVENKMIVDSLILIICLLVKKTPDDPAREFSLVTLIENAKDYPLNCLDLIFCFHEWSRLDIPSQCKANSVILELLLQATTANSENDYHYTRDTYQFLLKTAQVTDQLPTFEVLTAKTQELRNKLEQRLAKTRRSIWQLILHYLQLVIYCPNQVELVFNFLLETNLKPIITSREIHFISLFLLILQILPHLDSDEKQNQVMAKFKELIFARKDYYKKLPHDGFLLALDIFYKSQPDVRFSSQMTNLLLRFLFDYLTAPANDSPQDFQWEKQKFEEFQKILYALFNLILKKTYPMNINHFELILNEMPKILKYYQIIFKGYLASKPGINRTLDDIEFEQLSILEKVLDHYRDYLMLDHYYLLLNFLNRLTLTQEYTRANIKNLDLLLLLLEEIAYFKKLDESNVEIKTAIHYILNHVVDDIEFCRNLLKRLPTVFIKKIFDTPLFKVGLSAEIFCELLNEIFNLPYDLFNLFIENVQKRFPALFETLEVRRIVAIFSSGQSAMNINDQDIQLTNLPLIQGRTPQGEILFFEERWIITDNNCGFTASGLTREEVANILIENADNPVFQEELYPSIYKIFYNNPIVFSKKQALADAEKQLNEFSHQLRQILYSIDSGIKSLSINKLIKWLVAQCFDVAAHQLKKLQATINTLKREIKPELSKREMIIHYAEALRNDLQLDIPTAILCAKIKNINLYIWETDPAHPHSAKLLVHTETNPDQPITHVYFTNGATHFNQLNVVQNCHPLRQTLLRDHLQTPQAFFSKFSPYSTTVVKPTFETRNAM